MTTVTLGEKNMLPGSKEKVDAMAARFDARLDLWTGEPLDTETVEQLNREDEISRVRSLAASCSVDSILGDDDDENV
jgi:hypothetical protein